MNSVLKLIPLSSILALQVHAAPIELAPLAGSVWTGTFQSAGTNGDIKIAFLPMVNAKGEMQYYFELGEVRGSQVIASLLHKYDVACPLTPRAIALTTVRPGVYGGHISVYPCSENAETEVSHQKNSSRKATINVNVAEFKVSEDGKVLTILATVGPGGALKVHYLLRRAEAM